MITSKITKSILLCLTAIFVSSCLHYYDVNTQDVDTDGDCYTDVWEKKWGYDPLDPNDPPDHDNDCMTDEQEKVTDTHKDGINNLKVVYHNEGKTIFELENIVKSITKKYEELEDLDEMPKIKTSTKKHSLKKTHI